MGFFQLRFGLVEWLWFEEGLRVQVGRHVEVGGKDVFPAEGHTRCRNGHRWPGSASFATTGHFESFSKKKLPNPVEEENESMW